MQGIPIVSPIVHSLPTIHQSLSASGVPATSPHLTSSENRLTSIKASPGKCGEEYRSGLATNRAVHSRRPVRLDNHAYNKTGREITITWGLGKSIVILNLQVPR